MKREMWSKVIFEEIIPENFTKLMKISTNKFINPSENEAG